MPIVPFRSDAQPSQSPAMPALPSETYLMMAAAQMHKEGRLVKSDSNDLFKDIPATVRGGQPTELPKHQEPSPREYRGPNGKPMMMT